MRFIDLVRLTFRVLSFKYEQRKLTTSTYAVVHTKLGPVKGIKRLTICNGHYYSFERIPFAQPPIGELRFKAPLPAEPWTAELDCTRPADKPLQSYMFIRKYIGSEDCLYLNVYTNNPRPDSTRPVMVWIYGGGFQVGEATRDMYSPDFFMAKDIVLVTIAYRLGALGFLSLDDESLNVPGNAGLKDQVLALQWVKHNIEAFGGDPNNITLFGESAGAASTHLLLLSERTQGLVHRSIVMSGAALCPWALSPRNNWAYRLALKLGYTGENLDADVFAFLKHAKGSDIVKASAGVLNKEEKHKRILFAFGPVVEPYERADTIIIEQPYKLLQHTWSNTIPMLLGGTSFEGLLFYPEVSRRPATLDEVGNCVSLLPIDLNTAMATDEHARVALGLKLKQAYFGDVDCSAAKKMEFLELESHREFWHPIYRTVLARLRHSANAATYLYRFDYDSKFCNAIRIVLCGPEMRGVCHGDDMSYLFHSMLSYQATSDMPEYRTTQAMVDIWTTFATNGNPNCAALHNVNFAPATTNSSAIKCLNISEDLEYIDLPELDKLKVWNELYENEQL